MVEAEAQWDFHTKDSEEISFKKHETVVIIRPDAECDWLKAKNSVEKVGLVPANYLKLKPAPFFQPTVTRDEAIVKLINEPDGAYLIRKSESDKSQEVNLSLSVKYGDGVQHFKILMDSSYKFFLWVIKFRSLNEMIAYYETASVSRSQHITLLKMDAAHDVCVAAFDFRGEEEGEITFRKGDHIDIIEKTDRDWWQGKVKGTNFTGLFPASYVKITRHGDGS